MKKIAIVLLLLSVATFAVLKVGLWYFTKSFIDEKIQLASPVSKISYDKIDVSLAGTASLKKVKVFIKEQHAQTCRYRYDEQDLLQLFILRTDNPYRRTIRNNGCEQNEEHIVDIPAHIKII